MIDFTEHVRQSNLIENIDDIYADRDCLHAMQWLAMAQKIDHSTLLELHRKITFKQLPPDESGQYRRVQVYVGRHVPPHPNFVHHLIDNFMYDLFNRFSQLDPKEMHVRFEKIHPFIDGNGRTGRMLMWWHELKIGREPTLIKFEDRQSYYEWFRK